MRLFNSPTGDLVLVIDGEAYAPAPGDTPEEIIPKGADWFDFEDKRYIRACDTKWFPGLTELVLEQYEEVAVH